MNGLENNLNMMLTHDSHYRIAHNSCLSIILYKVLASTNERMRSIVFWGMMRSSPRKESPALILRAEDKAELCCLLLADWLLSLHFDNKDKGTKLNQIIGEILTKWRHTPENNTLYNHNLRTMIRYLYPSMLYIHVLFIFLVYVLYFVFN
jgi:hypothetical protein